MRKTLQNPGLQTEQLCPEKCLHWWQNQSFRINRYLALCGLGSRRTVETWIQSGQVFVNNQQASWNTRVRPFKDTVHIRQILIQPFPFLLYILLNKAKDRITTRTDPFGRKTIYDDLPHPFRYLLTYAGRLHRNTTGILILSNDGDLLYRLLQSHRQIPRTYHVRLDRRLTRRDAQQLLTGIPLDKNDPTTTVQVHHLEWLNDAHTECLLTITSGQYRIVHRLFQTLGYRVKKLDRCAFGPIHAKRIPRGQWRPLTLQEIRALHNACALPLNPQKQTCILTHPQQIQHILNRWWNSAQPILRYLNMEGQRGRVARRGPAKP